MLGVKDGLVTLSDAARTDDGFESIGTSVRTSISTNKNNFLTIFPLQCLRRDGRPSIFRTISPLSPRTMQLGNNRCEISTKLHK